MFIDFAQTDSLHFGSVSCGLGARFPNFLNFLNSCMSPKASPLSGGHDGFDRPKIGLFFESTNSYARELLRGVGEFVLGHTRWQIHYSEIGAREKEPEWLKRWNGAGLILRGENLSIARFVAGGRVPMVDLTPSRLLPEAPWVKSDDRAIAALAVEHFLERSYQSFAYCGLSNFRWSNHRGFWFSKLLAERGFGCDIFEDGGDEAVAIQTERIGEWLEKRPKPLAVLACFDTLARQVVEADT